MKRPSFQFYPGDWLSNKKLRRCTPAERGAWIDLICLLHDPDQATEYGLLRWPLRDIANAISCPLTLLRSLREKGVLKGAEAGETCAAHVYTPRHAGRDGEPVTLLPEQPGPVWYSSRMLEDEHIRLRRATYGEHKGASEGGIGEPSGGHPSRDARGRSASSSSSASDQPRAGRGTRLPADWHPAPDLMNWARTERPDLDLARTIASFRDFWVAKPGQGGVKLDWDATFRNWVRKEGTGSGKPLQSLGAPKLVRCGNCTLPITGGWTDSEKGRACDPCWDVKHATGKWPEKKAA